MKLWLDGQCLQTQHRRATCGFRTVDFLKELLQGDQQIDLHVSLNAQRLDDAVAARRYLAEHLPMATVQIWQSVVEEEMGVISRETPGHRLSRLAFTHHINCLAPDLALFPNPFEEGCHPLTSGFGIPYRPSNGSQPEPEHEILPELHHLRCISIGLFYKTSPILSEDKQKNITLKCDLIRRLKSLSVIIIEAEERTNECKTLQMLNYTSITSHEILKFNNFTLLKDLLTFSCYKLNDIQSKSISPSQVDLIGSSRSFLMSHIVYAHNDSQMVSKLMALSEPSEPSEPATSHVLFDSTGTLTCNRKLNTGIQRVVRQLSKQVNLNKSENIIIYDSNILSFKYLNSKIFIPSIRSIIIMIDFNLHIINLMKSEFKKFILCGSKIVNCIYDMIPILLPGTVADDMPEQFVTWFKFTLLYSDSIICISRAVADEFYTLLDGINFPRSIKIGFFQLGADMADASKFNLAKKNLETTLPQDFSRSPDSSEEVSDGFLKYSIKESKHLVFITVGSLEPRKGHRVILEAFEELWNQGWDIELKIVAGHGWKSSHLIEKLMQHPELGKRLYWYKRLDDHGLAKLYTNADALILASYAEGFGLPIAEAGYFGKPIIVSDLSVFREVSAAAPKAFFFTPGSAQDLAAQIRNFIRESQNGTLAKSKPVAWPTWAESMDQLRSVVLKDQYYKIYEPKVKQDPFKIDYIGEIYTQFHLHPNTQKYHLHVLEEPHISQHGGPLEMILSVKNLSDQLYASNQDLGYKLGVRLGARPAQDNSLATGYVHTFADIPFVLLPGHQLVMRISCPWANHPWWRNRITAVEIDLLQVLPDGYNWWGQSPLRVELPPHSG